MTSGIDLNRVTRPLESWYTNQFLAVFLAARNPNGKEMNIPRIVPQKPMATVSAARLTICLHLEKSGGSISLARASERDNPPMRDPISTFETLKEKPRITKNKDHHQILPALFRYCRPALEGIQIPRQTHKYPERCDR